MNLRKCIFTNNPRYKEGRQISPKGIMVHSTGANNPNLRRYVQPDDGLLGKNNNENHWNRSEQSVCVHAFIGKLADGSIATYQVLPWICRAAHCGNGKNGSANNTHIAFEICEDGLQESDYFNKIYREAVELTAFLCMAYRLDPLKDGVVICHSEGYSRGIASGHSDVMHWFPRHGKDMDIFRHDVAMSMKEEAGMTTEQIQAMIEKAIQAQKPPVWDKLEDVPEWGRATVEKLVQRGAISGTGNGLGLNFDQLRVLVVNDKAGLYD